MFYQGLHKFLLFATSSVRHPPNRSEIYPCISLLVISWLSAMINVVSVFMTVPNKSSIVDGTIEGYCFSLPVTVCLRMVAIRLFLLDYRLYGPDSDNCPNGQFSMFQNLFHIQITSVVCGILRFHFPETEFVV